MEYFDLNDNAVIEMENGDKIVIAFSKDYAVETVKNFKKLISESFFDGLIFHRVIKGFMIQGGGYDKEYKHHECDSIVGEFNSNGIENPIKHERGVISMARTNIKDSASSQFFIMHKDAPHLDGEYAAFGKVIEGMDAVDKIATTRVNHYQGDIPYEMQVIKTIRLGRD